MVHVFQHVMFDDTNFSYGLVLSFSLLLSKVIPFLHPVSLPALAALLMRHFVASTEGLRGRKGSWQIFGPSSGEAKHAREMFCLFFGYVNICIYIYIYIKMYINIYIYI